ncbi:hypothetical protein [Variovorax sp. PCZ-1]|uniref:hypothetical protein n=1 Tax=Variovorax sp. PCZ-1 TaxID=2835533 RepID=UPI001BCDE85E|nr:hypothetical protein [Variovorax sp. PCZ-1]MBS7809138.1 hypothetical protein [Variovorax sp. PCZ-1]
MNYTPALLALALFSIAFRADSMPTNGVFSSQIVSAQATVTPSGAKAKKPKKEKKAKGSKGGGVTFYEGSGETRAERDKRLTRECRGRSNSGLCEGYARP